MSEYNWDNQAKKAVEQAISQSPVPKLLRGTIKKKIMKAAEKAASSAGRSDVKPEDVMQGMLALMPANMREQVEAAMKQGPQGLKNLQNTLKK